jgi:hypothetical protein
MANDFDNHVIHLSEHNKFRKTAQFEQLPDQIKMLFAQHCMGHQQFAQQAQMQLAMQNPNAGNPGEPQQPQPAQQFPFR